MEPLLPGPGLVVEVDNETPVEEETPLCEIDVVLVCPVARLEDCELVEGVLKALIVLLLLEDNVVRLLAAVVPELALLVALELERLVLDEKGWMLAYAIAYPAAPHVSELSPEHAIGDAGE